MILLKLIFIAVVFICLWCGIKYLLLLYAKRNADKSMKRVFDELLQQYDAIINMFSQFHVLSLENRTLVQNTKKLIIQAQNFSLEKDRNEMIIAYANSVFENVQKFTDSILEKEPENEYIKKYCYLQSAFNKLKDDYNSSALKLRHYVDVFPTSLFARFKSITTMDLLND